MHTGEQYSKMDLTKDIVQPDNDFWGGVSVEMAKDES